MVLKLNETKQKDTSFASQQLENPSLTARQIQDLALARNEGHDTIVGLRHQLTAGLQAWVEGAIKDLMKNQVFGMRNFAVEQSDDGTLTLQGTPKDARFDAKFFKSILLHEVPRRLDISRSELGLDDLLKFDFDRQQGVGAPEPSFERWIKQMLPNVDGIVANMPWFAGVNVRKCSARCENNRLVVNVEPVSRNFNEARFKRILVKKLNKATALRDWEIRNLVVIEVRK